MRLPRRRDRRRAASHCDVGASRRRDRSNARTSADGDEAECEATTISSRVSQPGPTFTSCDFHNAEIGCATDERHHEATTIAVERLRLRRTRPTITATRRTTR